MCYGPGVFGAAGREFSHLRLESSQAQGACGFLRWVERLERSNDLAILAVRTSSNQFELVRTVVRSA